jgi:hypothetical protein
MGGAKEATITVLYRPRQQPPYEFRTTLPTNPKGELVFQNEGHDGFWLYYELDPRTFGDLVFPNDEQRALSSAVILKPGDECPKSGIWPEFAPHRVMDDNRTLEVRNKNGKLPPGKSEVRFGYTLFVTDDPNGGTLIPLDPIGNNQNGSTVNPLKDLIFPLLVAAVVGALGYVALRSRSAEE